MGKKKVVHIFDGKDIHLNPNLIRGIWDNREERHCHVFLVAQFSNKSKVVDVSEYLRLKDIGCDLRFVNSWYELYKIMSGFGLVFFHGNVSPVKKNYLLFFLLFFLKRDVLGRVVLVAWGGADFLNGKWWFPILKVLLGQTKGIVTLSKVDFDNCALVYPDKAIRLDYILVQGYGGLSKGVRDISCREEEKLRIFVSHSGWQQNNHHKSFRLIEKFKDKNIEVICPLAYGDESYISEIVSLGKGLFGEKFKFFTDLMSVDDYYELLSSADVFIASADIQTGLFAITTCLGGGSKVFCGDNLYASLSDEGYDVFYIDDLESISYRDFFEGSDELILKNRCKYLEKYGNPRNLVEKWGEVYDC